MRARKKVHAFVAVASLLLTACSTTTDSSGSELSGSLDPQPFDSKQVIKVAANPVNEVYSQLLLAMSLGEFEKENIEVEIVPLDSADYFPALSSGSVDAVATSISISYLNAVSQGAPIRMVMPTGANSSAAGFYVRSELVAGLPNSLRGKSIASTFGWSQPSMAVVKDYLDAADISIDEVNVEIIPTTELAIALNSGSVDAAWLIPPSHLPVIESKSAEFVIGYEGNPVSTGYFFEEKLLTKNPELGQAFIRALTRTTLTYLQGDYKQNVETAQALASAMNLSIEELTVTESILFDITSLESVMGLTEKNFLSAQEMWLEMGDMLLFEEPIKFEDYTDLSFVERILAENDL